MDFFFLVKNISAYRRSSFSKVLDFLWMDLPYSAAVFLQKRERKIEREGEKRKINVIEKLKEGGSWVSGYSLSWCQTGVSLEIRVGMVSGMKNWGMQLIW